MLRPAVLATTLLFPALAGAQQVIPKGFWVLVNTADPNLRIGNVFPTADACKAGWENALVYALAAMDAKILAAQRAEKVADAYADKLKKDESSETAALNASIGAGTDATSAVLDKYTNRLTSEDAESARLDELASQADYAAQAAESVESLIKTASCIQAVKN